MEIKITQPAIEVLKDKISMGGNKSGVRVYVAGVGWGGPTFGLVLDEPKAADGVQEVEGIKVLFDKELSAYTKGFEIDFKNSLFGKRFVVNQLYGGGSCR